MARVKGVPVSCRVCSERQSASRGRIRVYEKRRDALEVFRLCAVELSVIVVSVVVGRPVSVAGWALQGVMQPLPLT